MRKIFALVLTLVMVLSATATAETTVEFFQQKPEEGPQAAYAAVIEKFQAANPDYVIEMNTVPDAGTVLSQRMATGDTPATFSDYPTQVQFKTKIANGYVLNLSDYDFMKNVNEGYLSISVAPDGGYYAMPISSNYMAIFYNVDLFEQCGITELPRTWDELVQVCETLKAAGVTPFSFGDKDPGRVGHCFQAVGLATYPELTDYSGKGHQW